MSANQVLFDAPGPRARRRIRVVTVVSLLAIAAIVYLAIARFADSGQLTAAKWNVFTLPYVRSFLWDGRVNTMKLTVVSGVLALPLGVLLALLRLAHNRALRWVGTAYVEVFRSVPLLLLVLMLPPLGINLPTFWKICVPIVMCNAAVLAEIFRAGVNALPKGQLEASLARRADLLAGHATCHLPAVDPVDHPVAGHPTGLAAQGLDPGVRGQLPGIAADRERADRPYSHPDPGLHRDLADLRGDQPTAVLSGQGAGAAAQPDRGRPPGRRPHRGRGTGTVLPMETAPGGAIMR